MARTVINYLAENHLELIQRLKMLSRIVRDDAAPGCDVVSSQAAALSLIVSISNAPSVLCTTLSSSASNTSMLPELSFRLSNVPPRERAAKPTEVSDTASVLIIVLPSASREYTDERRTARMGNIRA